MTAIAVETAFPGSKTGVRCVGARCDAFFGLISPGFERGAQLRSCTRCRDTP